MPAAAPAVRIRGLTHRYGSRLVLDDVDLELAPGELRGLLGPNGAGKTTLLRTMLGLTDSDGGTVEVLGCSVGGPGEPPVAGVAGFVEEPAFYPYLSGRRNLELLARLDDGPGLEIDFVLEQVGLDARAEDRVAGYSTGMRQRLGLAAALIRRPHVLLLDEPTSGLDPRGSRAVAALLKELCAGGVAVLFSSHLIGELEPLCDSITILRHGRVAWQGSTPALAAQAPVTAHRLVTSDDEQALQLARRAPGVKAEVDPDGRGLRVSAGVVELDRLVAQLGRSELAVRALEQLESPLQTMFFRLTE